MPPSTTKLIRPTLLSTSASAISWSLTFAGNSPNLREVQLTRKSRTLPLSRPPSTPTRSALAMRSAMDT